MNKNLKIGIGLAVGFAGYKLYSLYQLGEKISYTPVGFDYSDSTIKVKMELNNPTNTSLKMRGIEGTIALKDGTLLSTYSSDPFLIKPGITFFTLNFKVNYITAGAEVIKLLVSFNTPELVMKLKKKIPLISINETFVIQPSTLR